MESELHASITPINSLQKRHRSGTIKVIVMRQSIQSSKKTAKPLRKVILADDEGTKIYALLFGHSVQDFSDTLLSNKTYFITNAAVNEINKDFMNVHPEIELNIQSNTIVTEAQEGLQKTNIEHQFVEFKDVITGNDQEQQLDVVGYLYRVKRCFDYKRGDNSIGYRREIVIMNDEFQAITINLWDDMALYEGQWLNKKVTQKPLIAFSNLKRNLYNGQVQLKTTTMSTLIVDPTCIKSTELKLWLQPMMESETLEELSMENLIEQAQEVELGDLINNRGKLQEQKLYWFKGIVDMVENKSLPWYDSCNDCYRTVVTTETGIECTHCNKKNIEATPRFRITLTVSADNEIAKVTLFEEAATIYIGDSISNYIKSTYEKDISKCIEDLEATENKMYKFLFKLDINVELKNGIISIVAEAVNCKEKPKRRSFAKHDDIKEIVVQEKRRTKSTKTPKKEPKEDLIIPEQSYECFTIEKKRKKPQPKKDQTQTPSSRKTTRQPKKKKNIDFIDLDDDEIIGNFSKIQKTSAKNVREIKKKIKKEHE